MGKKNISVKDLKKLISEEEVRGLSVTNKAKKESGKYNKQGLKDAKNKLSDYFKSIGAEDQYSKEMAPNKYNYDDSFEKTYHDEMEILSGQEMNQYDSIPDSRFQERSKKAIEGSSDMGNNPEWANVIPKQLGFTGPDFGKNLVKRIEASAKKRGEDTPAISLRGRDIQELPTKKINNGHKPYAIKENNNKTQLKETMKRLVFKKDFNGVGNALKLIPESYKVDKKVFEMTDGNENYRIRWEGNSNKGKAVILIASDKNLVNEDMQRMKQLFSYKSQDTLGTLKGNERIDENKKFSDIWSKTKSLLIENEDMDEPKMMDESGMMDEDLYENEYLLEYDDEDEDDEDEDDDAKEDDDGDEDDDDEMEPSDVKPEDVKPADVPKEDTDTYTFKLVGNMIIMNGQMYPLKTDAIQKLSNVTNKMEAIKNNMSDYVESKSIGSARIVKK